MPIKSIAIWIENPAISQYFLDFYSILYSDEEIRETYSIISEESTDSIYQILENTPLKLSIWQSMENYDGSKYVSDETFDFNALLGYLSKMILEDRSAMRYKDYYFSGWILSTMKNHYEAIEAFSKSLEMFPALTGSNPYPSKDGIISSKAESKLAVQDYFGAISDFSTALEIDEDYGLYLGRAKSYHNLGQFEKAIQDYTSCIIFNERQQKDEKVNPKEAYILRGQAYLKIDKEKACLDFSKAGELGNKYAYVLIDKNCL